MSLLQGVGLTKTFGRLIALDHVDLCLQRGETVGLIGPNGAGKSTLVNLISGLESPTEGTLMFDGRPLKGLAPSVIARLGVARTFQIAQPFRTMSACQNVAVAALFRGSPATGVGAALREAEEILHFVGLGRQSRSPASTLTTPDLRRLELAKALALRPRLLLLDEVMAGLTPKEVDDQVATLHEVERQGVTLLVIEHVLRAVMRLCDRVIVLHHGRKIAEGAPENVTADPVVVRAYLGSLPDVSPVADDTAPVG